MKPRKRRPGVGGVKSGVGMRAYAAEETLPERRIDLCRTPHKVAYRTRAEAKRAILTPGSRGRLHAYRCPCGRFHNGTAAAKPD